MRDRQTMRDIGNTQTYTDKILECVDCGTRFYWTSGEQRYYHDKGLAPVKRCPKCREYRRRTIHPPIDFNETIAQAKALFPNDDHQGVSRE